MGVLTPVFYQGEWVGFCASMAHKSDIGGTVPGSGSGTAREIFEEGLHLPAVKFMDAGRPVRELEWLIHANSRTRRRWWWATSAARWAPTGWARGGWPSCWTSTARPRW